MIIIKSSFTKIYKRNFIYDYNVSKTICVQISNNFSSSISLQNFKVKGWGKEPFRFKGQIEIYYSQIGLNSIILEYLE